MVENDLPTIKDENFKILIQSLISQAIGALSGKPAPIHEIKKLTMPASARIASDVEETKTDLDLDRDLDLDLVERKAPERLPSSIDEISLPFDMKSLIYDENLDGKLSILKKMLSGLFKDIASLDITKIYYFVGGVLRLQTTSKQTQIFKVNFDVVVGWWYWL